jgi:hypothetical protein
MTCRDIFKAMFITNVDSDEAVAVKPALIDWNRYCSAYTLSFVVPIPYAGAYLYLIGTALSRSGFWMSSFWLFIHKRISEEVTTVEMKDYQRAADRTPIETPSTPEVLPRREVRHLKPYYYNPVDGYQEAHKKDLWVVGFHYLYDPIRGRDKFVDCHGDMGRVLRIICLIAIPAVSLLVLNPNWRSGYDFIGRIFILLREARAATGL